MKVIDFRTSKFVMAPRTLVEDKTLSPRDKTVYLTLCLYANNESKQAYPSAETIGEYVGCSRNSVFRAVAKLEKAGYIKRENRKNGLGRQTTNIYYLLDK